MKYQFEIGEIYKTSLKTLNDNYSLRFYNQHSFEFNSLKEFRSLEDEVVIITSIMPILFTIVDRKFSLTNEFLIMKVIVQQQMGCMVIDMNNSILNIAYEKVC